MTKEELGSLHGKFTWDFGNKFHIETAVGNFEWSCPDYYGGTGEIRPVSTYKEWVKQQNIPYGRDKSVYKISDYCGDFVYKGKN